jgi:hypothetical protein
LKTTASPAQRISLRREFAATPEQNHHDRKLKSTTPDPFVFPFWQAALPVLAAPVGMSALNRRAGSSGIAPQLLAIRIVTDKYEIAEFYGIPAKAGTPTNDHDSQALH